MPTPLKVVELTRAYVLEKSRNGFAPSQIAQELNDLHQDPTYCKRSSVQWVIDRYLTEEEKKEVKLLRKHKKR
jgi:uncharacterized protein YjaG (DUF416 family)